MSADRLIAALGAKRVGATWLARCPVHHDATPSLSIAVGHGGKMLVHCFAGCPQTDVIAELRRRDLWSRDGRSPPYTPPVAADCPDRAPSQSALKIWTASRHAIGTPLQRYLAGRGLTATSPRLRFHPSLNHPAGAIWPAMVALVSNVDDEPVAIHRTFLSRDGSTKAPVFPDKMMLGPCRGGAIRLADAKNFVMVGEGIESCLSAMQATGHPAWAALSTSGLRTLQLPSSIQKIIILADGDPPGEAAASAAASRWRREDRCVRIARPPRGSDFNDMLRRGADMPEEFSA